ncbi:MAG: sulfite exporter TauE/SafE family protein, partial [Planctomycetaceae bacterium]|nr:sulfite exporter TauE/SafE family protein [Planctomycetaceae bacterium]
MHPLSLIFGAVVGLSLGLTGGGGAIFAVPLLVYGLAVPAREAVAVSLAAVGATSFVGFLHRWKLGEVEIPTGLLFAAAGMIGAPLGTWLASLVPDAVLLLAFAGLMLVVAWRLWQQATKPHAPITDCPPSPVTAGPTCQRDAAGQLRLTSRCAMLLLAIGVLTGTLSGLFGVGGGFVIVPALVLFSSLPIHRAVGTSLLVIALVSLSGIASQVWSGRTIPFEITALFVIGGVGGLFLGQRIGRRLSGPLLQKVFVVAILLVAV